MASIVHNNHFVGFAEEDNRERDLVLGSYMSAVSNLETVVRLTFRKLSGIDGDKSNIIFDRIGAKEQNEIIGEFIASDKSISEEFSGIAKNLDLCAKHRNEIVHATWGVIDGLVARFWSGLTEEHFEHIVAETDKGNSLRGRHIFTLEQIGKAKAECDDAAILIGSLLERSVKTGIDQRINRLAEQVAKSRGVPLDEFLAQHASNDSRK